MGQALTRLQCYHSKVELWIHRGRKRRRGSLDINGGRTAIELHLSGMMRLAFTSVACSVALHEIA